MEHRQPGESLPFLRKQITMQQVCRGHEPHGLMWELLPDRRAGSKSTVHVYTCRVPGREEF